LSFVGLNGAHNEDFDVGWKGFGMNSLKESSISQGVYSYNKTLGVLIAHFLIPFKVFYSSSLFQNFTSNFFTGK
jgi:hypothetical protein